MERNTREGTTQFRSETQAAARRDEQGPRAGLDACYGRIGIPAVAAAVPPRHQERRPVGDRRVMPYARD